MLASGERSSESADLASSPRSGSVRPAASQASAQRMPSPPAFVSTATRRPFGSGWADSSAATSTSSSSDPARITPAWWKSASTAASEPARAAVCELAARCPVAVVPLFSASTGLLRATRRARRPKRRGFPNDSTYMSTTSVESSSSHHSSRSLVDTSALLPIETNAERPRPRDSDASSNARPSAPDWEEKPMFPAGAVRAANVALRLGPDTATPRQLGPMRRAPCERTNESSRSWRAAPSLPISANPAEMTTSARTPRRRACSAASSTATAGSVITARSTASGISSIVRYPRTPATGSPSRFTGYAAPVKSPARMLRKSSPPIEPRRLDAPTTATLPGSKNGRSEATTASWSRASTCSR